ncbi:MAG TPA: hypothetical protein VMT54_19060 [Candidatus Cybelea sp.]|nr:hypothetical protein [Candidatus Cybelea sp.]
MTVVRAILAELVSLFIDDGALALLAVLLIAAVAAAVKLFTLPPLAGALLLFAGCIAILADSLRRAAAKRRG